MLPSHIHGPNCGCKEYAFSEENEDLLGSIILDKVQKYKNKVWWHFLGLLSQWSQNWFMHESFSHKRHKIWKIKFIGVEWRPWVIADGPVIFYANSINIIYC